MRRCDLLALIGGALIGGPLIARAQRKSMPVVGLLSASWPAPTPRGDAVHQGLREIGYVDGQSVAFEYRFAEDHYDRLPGLAGDLISRKVDVIVTIGGTPPAQAAKSATSTIPIIFTSVGDPVGIGLVASLARPG